MNLLPFIVAGLASGAVYGLAGVGLVLTYKTSGIFNFAYGTISTAAAFIFYTLYIRHGLPWWLAALISVTVVGLVFGLGIERLARAATGSPLGTRVVATVGLLTFIEAGVILIYGEDYHAVKGFLGNGTFHIGSTAVTWAQLIIMIVAIIATAILYLYFRRTRGGVAMRAVVDDPSLLDLAGTSPIAVRRRAWIIGTSFAAISGILLVQLLGEVDPTTLTLLVVQAFAAAAVGAFTSLPLTFGGGIALGIGAALCTKYFHNGLWSGLAASLPFILLMAVLLFTPRWRLAEQTLLVRRPPTPWRAPMRVQMGGGLCVLVFLGFAPFFVGLHLDAWTSLLTYVILFASLGLLVRTAGEVSLCQVSFLAIGVAAFSHLTVQHHLPWLVALLVAAAITLPVGALLAIPAIRLSGLYLALVSLGFGLVLQYMFYSQNYMFGSNGIGLTIARPSLSWVDVSSDRGYYYLVLVITVLIAGLLVVLTNGRLGRLLRALAASPTGLATSGASVNVTRVLVFCLAAAIAAIAGVLSAGVIGVVSSDNYPPLLSLTYFVVIMIAGGREPWYALFAGAGVALLPIYVQNSNIDNYLTLAFGLFAMVYVMVPPERRGVPEVLRRAIDRLGGAARKPAFQTGAPAVAATEVIEKSSIAREEVKVTAAARAEATDWPGLEVKDLCVTFGGLVAVNGVSLEARPGRITGLIGPNGAGKTTVFNACSGLNQPKDGRLLVGGASMWGRGVSARARMGLGRTFQQMNLFDDLTVAENVAIGREGGFAGYNPVAHLWSSRRERRVIDSATGEALALCRLQDIADAPVGALSTGQRRSVELARCLAGPFRVLLLDEPSSGLDHHETEAFGDILRQVVNERGVAILLVEHDLELVTRICNYIYVLEFGEMLFEGTPAEVLRSSDVQTAYLGGDVLAGKSGEVAGAQL
jgi:ABC-type branched-subunit amino acid transport system ATPase component/branched-subunit amino acid ABC-type transport system permease component